MDKDMHYSIIGYYDGVIRIYPNNAKLANSYSFEEKISSNPILLIKVYKGKACDFSLITCKNQKSIVILKITNSSFIAESESQGNGKIFAQTEQIVSLPPAVSSNSYLDYLINGSNEYDKPKTDFKLLYSQPWFKASKEPAGFYSMPPLHSQIPGLEASIEKIIPKNNQNVLCMSLENTFICALGPILCIGNTNNKDLVYLQGHAVDIIAIGIDPGSMNVASADDSEKSNIIIWSSTHYKLLKRLRLPTNAPYKVRLLYYSIDHHLFVATNAPTSTLYMYDSQYGGIVFSIKMYNSLILDMCIAKENCYAIGRNWVAGIKSNEKNARFLQSQESYGTLTCITDYLYDALVGTTSGTLLKLSNEEGLVVVLTSKGAIKAINNTMDK